MFLFYSISTLKMNRTDEETRRTIIAIKNKLWKEVEVAVTKAEKLLAELQ